MSTRTPRITQRWGRQFAGSLLVAALLPLGAGAQSAQLMSLQVSGLGAYPFGGGLENVDFGGGWEAQLRVSPSAFSIGAGVEQTFHTHISGRSVDLLGGFLEPRYVIDIGSDNAVLYLSGRAAFSQISIEDGTKSGTGYTLNGGGGVLFRLGDRLCVRVDRVDRVLLRVDFSLEETADGSRPARRPGRRPRRTRR